MGKISIHWLGAALSIISQLYFLLHCHIYGQGVTKRCRLSWLTNSALVYDPKCGGGRELWGLSQWVQLCTWSPNKLWRSNSIFNLCLWVTTFCSVKKSIRVNIECTAVSEMCWLAYSYVWSWPADPKLHFNHFSKLYCKAGSKEKTLKKHKGCNFKFENSFWNCLWTWIVELSKKKSW